MASRPLTFILTMGAAASALLTSAMAQAPAPKPDAVKPPATAATAEEEVVVTGTRSKGRTVLSTPVPVDVISSADLARSGALGGEFGQALQNLVPSFNFPRQSNSGSADIVRPAQLRGLSPDQVLVLVNGKRRHTTSVITTEAKTGRGTAAVDFNSLPANAIKRIEVLRDGAGAQYGSDAIAGVINVILDDAPTGVEIAASYGAHHTEFDPTRQTLTDGRTWILQGKIGLPIGEAGGFVRLGIEYKERGETNRAGFDQVPFWEDPANVPLVGGKRNYRPGDGATKDLNLWFNAEAPIGSDITLYAFGTYNKRDAQGTGFFRYPVGSTNFLAVNPLGYRPVTTGDNQDLALTAGLRGEAGAWSWDASVNYGRNRFERGVKNTLNPSLGPTSPRSFFTGASELELFSLNADASHELDIGQAEPALLSFGLEYRRENFQSFAGDPQSYAAGPFAAPPNSKDIGAQAGGGLRPSDTRKLDRSVFSAYADFSATFGSLFAEVAARYENSSDYGDTVSGKAALRWAINEHFALRGSISNSYRAPSLVQIGFANSSTSFGAGGALTSVGTLTPDDPLARALGARDLKAESAVSWSVGATFNTDSGFRMTVDGYQIKVDDRITLSERIDATSAPLAVQPIFAARNITAANFFTNAVDTQTRGVDIVATQTLKDVWSGTLNLSAAFSYSETEVTAVRNLGPVTVLGVEERNTLQGAAPKSKVILSADWTDDTWSALLRLTHYGSATRIFNFGGGFEPEQTYSGEFQLDAEFGWQVTENFNWYAGASNLLDAYPDRSSSDINYFGNFPYDVLSPIGMNGRYLYTGFRAKF